VSRTLRQHLRCACSATESRRRSVVEFLGRSSESRHRVATSIGVSCSSLCSTRWDVSWLKRRSERLVSLAIESKTLEISLGARDRPDFGTVRPRVQIPGPRPSLYSKSAISESLRSQLHRAGSQFPKEQPNRGGVNGVVVGLREIAGQRPVAAPRPKPADSQHRTVRHCGM